jgi:hypothetical protein
VGRSGQQNEEMNKTPIAQRGDSLRAEKDIRLRIDLLEGQSSSIAKMLAKAIRDHNEAAFKEYAERLAANRGRVEELLWVLGEKAGQSILDLQVAGSNSSLSVKQIIEKLKAGELKMDDLSSDAQADGEKGRARNEKHAQRLTCYH